MGVTSQGCFVNPKLFPTIMIILSLGAAVVWFSQGNWRMGCYWVAAAVLTTMVTF